MTSEDRGFNKLMGMPDIEQAANTYQKMSEEIKSTITSRIPELSNWMEYTQPGRSSCGKENGGPGKDGEKRGLAGVGVKGKISDDKYELALKTIGEVAQRYGFDPNPQRLHDSPGSHDAVFHNVHDDSEVSFGTEVNTSLDISVGCHLTTEAKKRGTPSES